MAPLPKGVTLYPSNKKPPSGRPDDLLIRASFARDIKGPESSLDSTPANGFAVTKALTGEGNLKICVAVTPARIHGEIDSGGYRGTIVVTASRVKMAAIPVALSFRQPRVVAVAWVLGGAAIGIIIKALLEAAAGRKTGKWSALTAYLSNLSFVLNVWVGSVAVLASFYLLYKSKNTWGVDNDSWKLFGTAIGAHVGGSSVADTLKRIGTGQTAA